MKELFEILAVKHVGVEGEGRKDGGHANYNHFSLNCAIPQALHWKGEKKENPSLSHYALTT